MRRAIAALVLLFTFSLIAFAHGNEKHVMGTVTSITDNSITVETTAKQSVTVEVNDKTKFEKSGAAAALKDLKVGDRIVIHANASGDKLIASEVQFGKRPKSMEGMKGMEGMEHK
jgi:hypothetical protein